MNCLSQVRAYTLAVFRNKSLIVARYSLNQCYFPKWKTNFGRARVRTGDLEYLQAQFRVECYATRSSSGRRASRSRKSDPATTVENEKDAFFVVRKGDIVGIYKSLTDCQAQVGSSVSDPPVSVYRGHSLSKDAEDYLACYGLKNAIFAVNAVDLKHDLFGSLKPCLFQDPTVSEVEMSNDGDVLEKRLKEIPEAGNGERLASAPVSDEPLQNISELEHSAERQANSSESVRSCVIEFDGASRGNPGLAGAGVVLKSENGSLICKLRQGLGVATCNAAEYRAIILGLKYALEKGYKSIHVKGDSKLVCMQMQGLWKVRNENLSQLYNEAKRLQDEFLSFEITHFLRNHNSDADSQANLAACLAEGEIQVDIR